MVESDPSDGVRYEAADSLAKMGPAAKAGMPALIRLVKDQSQGYSRVGAAGALAAIDPQSKEAVQALIEALRSQGDTYEDGKVTDMLEQLIKDHLAQGKIRRSFSRQFPFYTRKGAGALVPNAFPGIWLKP